MMDEKKDIIRKKIKNGFPEGEIKMQLQKEGLTEEEIKEIFSGPKKDMRYWYLTWAIIILLLAIYMYLKTGLVSLLFFGFSGLLFYEYYKAQRKEK
jgi:hypothetical protein